MKKQAFTLCAAAALALSAAPPAAAPQAEAVTEPLTIMCIGDSITDGYGIAGSYRKFLYHGLTEDGYSVEMTGDSSENQGYLSTYTADDGTSFQYDDDHSGHSGYTILSYGGRSGIYEQIQSTNCIAKYQPQIVILQIGTNDAIDNHELADAGSRLQTLINYILGEMPAGAALFVTEIPDVQPNRSDVRTWFNNYRYSETWQEYSDEETAARVKAGFDLYNSVLSETVTAMQQQHSNMYLCHVNRTLTDLDAQLADGVHPNNVGYARMGSYWTDIVGQYLTGKLTQDDPPQTETTTTTAATTSSAAYTTTVSTSSSTHITGQVDFEVRGDVNENGARDLADAVLIAQFLIKDAALTDTQLVLADVDKDHTVNAKDLTLLKRLLLEDV